MDLNVVIYDYETATFEVEKSILKIIDCCYKLGYKCIALNVKVNGNDIEKIPIPPEIKVNQSDLKIYRRLTIKIDDMHCLYPLTKKENIKYYDLLALEPTTEKVLNYLNSGNFDFDIISFGLNVDQTTLNLIKKVNFSLSISKGIGIEINYSNCLSSSSQRRQAIAFGQLIVTKTNSKNIIISSGTNVASQIRSPRDIVYMGLLFGLQENQSKKAVYQNPLNVIKHSELRKNPVTSIIDIINDDNIYNELKNVNKNEESDAELLPKKRQKTN